MTDTSLDDLAAELKIIIPQWLQKCTEAGLDVKITETWRDPKREDELHTKGITKATGLTCQHCHMEGNVRASRAVDFACFRNHVYIKNGEDIAYALAGQIARSLGLRWGGGFRRPDWDHIELA